MTLEMTGLTEKRWARAVHSYARALMANGADTSQVEQELLRRNIDPRIAFAVAHATELAKGKSTADEISRWLIARGVDNRVAPVMSADAVESRETAIANAIRSRNARRCMILGSPVVALGAVIYAGNRTGLYPSIPFLGYCVTGLGIMLVAAGARMNAERLD
jgi:hypothetical protein